MSWKERGTLNLALAFLLISVIFMTLWWQILFQRNIENYIPARLFVVEQKEKKRLQNPTLKPDVEIFQEALSCQALLCLSHRGKIYEIKREYLKKLEAERNAEERIFFYESLFLILVLVSSALYLFFLIRSERRRLHEKAEFLAMATHELKHPLSSLVLLLEGMKNKVLTREKQKMYLEKGLLELKGLSESLESILNLQQNSHYEIKEKEPFSLYELLNSLKKELEEQYNAKGRIVLREELHIPCRKNKQGMRLIFRNLMENALLYSRDAVHIGVNKRDKKYIEIYVQDKGFGFTPEEKMEAGKLFFRSPRHEIQNIKGSGLGLFSVYHLAKKMNIEVSLHSRGANQGSVFFLRFKNL
ncbi:MAG: HAMP domain-containing sensor histidine kinase [Leptospiraceae bacterium]|nr:HAMP domain-containing sensor histidine kinase [Leptospiraceae bacterium]